MSHNAAGRASTLAQLYWHLGHPVALLGSHFPQWERELWEPIRGAVRQQGLPVHTFVVEHEPSFVNQAWQLVLQQLWTRQGVKPAEGAGSRDARDSQHQSKPHELQPV